MFHFALLLVLMLVLLIVSSCSCVDIYALGQPLSVDPVWCRYGSSVAQWSYWNLLLPDMHRLLRSSQPSLCTAITKTEEKFIIWSSCWFLPMYVCLEMEWTFSFLKRCSCFACGHKWSYYQVKSIYFDMCCYDIMQTLSKRNQNSIFCVLFFTKTRPSSLVSIKSLQSMSLRINVLRLDRKHLYNMCRISTLCEALVIRNHQINDKALSVYTASIVKNIFRDFISI